VVGKVMSFKIDCLSSKQIACLKVFGDMWGKLMFGYYGSFQTMFDFETDIPFLNMLSKQQFISR
jgi:hypothetical protein